MNLFRLLPVFVAVSLIGFAAPASAAPPDRCDPWPGCKDNGAGDPPGLSTCNEVFIPGADSCYGLDPPGSECVVTRSTDNTPGWFFTEDCVTSSTLVVPYSDPILGGRGHTLELVYGASGWQGGRAGITNEGSIARVADLTIRVTDSNVANGSCVDSGIVQTAISLDPHISGTDSGVPRMASANLVITTRPSPDDPPSDAQFCNGIEYGSDAFDIPIIVPMFVGGISGNTIDDDSFSNAAIVTRYINATDNITGDSDQVTISDNTIHYSSNACVGVSVGPRVERIHLNDNTVDSPGGCGGGTGIAITDSGVGGGNFLAPLPIRIEGNVVDTTLPGADIGISIENSAVERNQGNTLTGDDNPGVEEDVPYYTCGNVGSVPFPTNGKKKNTFNGSEIADSVDCSD
jgi:hypothetical protein